MKSLKAIFLLWVMTMAVSVEAVMASNPPEKKPRIIITADPDTLFIVQYRLSSGRPYLCQ